MDRDGAHRSRKPTKALCAFVLILYGSAVGLAWYQSKNFTNRTASTSITNAVSTRIDGLRTYASRELHNSENVIVDQGQHDDRTETKSSEAVSAAIAASKIRSRRRGSESEFGYGGGVGMLPLLL
jgi:hypothetical protein